MLPHGHHPRAGKSPAIFPGPVPAIEGHPGPGGGGGGARFIGAPHGPVQFMSPSPGRPPAAEAESAIKLRQATELKIQETEAGLRRLLLLHTVLTNIDSSSPVPATPSPPPMVDGDDEDDDRWVTSPPSPGPKPSAAALRAVPPPRLVLPSGAGPAAAAALLAAHAKDELAGGSGGKQKKKRVADDDDAADGVGEADLGSGWAMLQDSGAGGTGGSTQMVSPAAAAAAAKLHPGSPDFGFAEASGIFGGPSAASGGSIAAAVDLATVAIGSPMKKRKTFALVPSSSMPAAAGLSIPTFGTSPPS